MRTPQAAFAQQKVLDRVVGLGSAQGFKACGVLGQSPKVLRLAVLGAKPQGLINDINV